MIGKVAERAVSVYFHLQARSGVSKNLFLSLRYLRANGLRNFPFALRYRSGNGLCNVLIQYGMI